MREAIVHLRYLDATQVLSPIGDFKDFQLCDAANRAVGKLTCSHLTRGHQLGKAEAVVAAVLLQVHPGTLTAKRSPSAVGRSHVV